MACPVYDVSVRGLRRAHFIQLRSYAEARDLDGWYTGNRGQFETRHKDLVEWLDSVIECYNED